MRNRTGKSKINYVNYLKGVFKFTLIHLIKLSLYLYNTVFMTESALKQKLDVINSIKHSQNCHKKRYLTCFVISHNQWNKKTYSFYRIGEHLFGHNLNYYVFKLYKMVIFWFNWHLKTKVNTLINQLSMQITVKKWYN